MASTSSALVARCASLQRIGSSCSQTRITTSHASELGRCPHRALVGENLRAPKLLVGLWPRHALGSHARSSHLRRLQPEHVGTRHPLYAWNGAAAVRPPDIGALGGEEHVLPAVQVEYLAEASLAFDGGLCSRTPQVPLHFVSSPPSKLESWLPVVPLARVGGGRPACRNGIIEPFYECSRRAPDQIRAGGEEYCVVVAPKNPVAARSESGRASNRRKS